MKIAITGSSGAVGRAVCATALARGHTVVGLDLVEAPEIAELPGFTFTPADTSDYDLLVAQFAGCDAVIHLAAIAAPFEYPDHIVHNRNATGSYNVMRAAIEQGITSICQASSVNAVGLTYNRVPRIDYFPIDEQHANYTEEAYGLSKWICEQQADAFARRYENIGISSLRFHWVVSDRKAAAGTAEHPRPPRNLWAYTTFDAAAEACLLSVEASFRGHEVLYIVAPDTTEETPTLDLVREHFPSVQIRTDLPGNRGLFDCKKAERVLGFRHPPGGRPSTRPAA